MDEYLTILPSTHDELALNFDWYEQIRLELIRPMLCDSYDVLDVGTGDGGVLIQIADSVRSGVGIDTNAKAIATAVERSTAAGIRNLRFETADAQRLPVQAESYDVVFILGDVLSYSALFGRTRAVLSEASRALRAGGTLVVDGMDWSWEYSHSPDWCFFLRTDEGGYTYCSADRTAEGLETIHNWPVVLGCPLHQWLTQQAWPVADNSAATTIDVRLRRPLPPGWLGEPTVERSQYFTQRTLTDELIRSGFGSPQAVSYGLTYDVVSGAGLTEVVRAYIGALARSEAQTIRVALAGAGPWLMAWTVKPE